MNDSFDVFHEQVNVETPWGPDPDAPLTLVARGRSDDTMVHIFVPEVLLDEEEYGGSLVLTPKEARALARSLRRYMTHIGVRR